MQYHTCTLGSPQGLRAPHCSRESIFSTTHVQSGRHRDSESPMVLEKRFSVLHMYSRLGTGAQVPPLYWRSGFQHHTSTIRLPDVPQAPKMIQGCPLHFRMSTPELYTPHDDNIELFHCKHWPPFSLPSSAGGYFFFTIRVHRQENSIYKKMGPHRWPLYLGENTCENLKSLHSDD